MRWAAGTCADCCFRDYDLETVTRTGILFCFYPFAFSLAIFGPDSLLLLTVCFALYHARRGSWGLAALAAEVASATRVQGVLLVPCLLYLYLKQREFAWRRLDRSFLMLLLTPAGLLAFMWRLWQLTGNPLAFVGIQRAWNNSPSYPFAFLIRFLREPALIGDSGWNPEFLTVMITCGMAPVLVWSYRRGRIPVEYSLFFALQWIVLACRTSTMGNLRYVTSCFPFFLALGILTKRPVAFGLLLGAFAGFFGLFTALFAAGQQHHPGYHFVAF